MKNFKLIELKKLIQNTNDLINSYKLVDREKADQVYGYGKVPKYIKTLTKRWYELREIYFTELIKTIKHKKPAAPKILKRSKIIRTISDYDLSRGERNIYIP